MTRLIFLILVILICNVHVEPRNFRKYRSIHQFKRRPGYWDLRKRLILAENKVSLGGKLQLNPTELKANEVLMAAKNREIQNGFITGNTFLPSFNFMEVISKIEQSEVFKILRDLPKGGVLHTHDTAMASLDYKFNNLSYREKLYLCDVNETLRLKFFDTPDSDCDWQLLSKVRQDPVKANTINERIKREMTMVTKNPKIVYDTVEKAWQKFNSIFKFMKSWLRYRPIYEDYFYQSLQELYDDNVMYVEVRAGLSGLYDLDGNKFDSLEVLKILQNIINKFKRNNPDFIDVKIIYAPHRSIDAEKLDDSLEKVMQFKEHFPNLVVGFDLVGQEDKGKPLTDFIDKLNEADPSIQYFFHAGETNWYGESTDMNLWDALLLRTKRIGHGYALMKHPVILALVKNMSIAVEVCPISNQVLALVEDMRNHPATSLFSLGVPMVISSDDPSHWGAKGLTYDFYEAFMGIMGSSADLKNLKQLAKNSLIYSSMNNFEKNKALNLWQYKWDSFVANLAQSHPINRKEEAKTDITPVLQKEGERSQKKKQRPVSPKLLTHNMNYNKPRIIIHDELI